MEFCKIIDVENEGKQICFRDKEIENIEEMFQTRLNLHRKAYQHKTSHLINQMVIDMLCLVDPFITFKGKDGQRLRLSETIDDMTAYTKVNDSVIHQIGLLDCDHIDVLKAQGIQDNIMRRKLYPYIGNTVPVTDASVTRDRLVSCIKDNMEKLTTDEQLCQMASQSLIVIQFHLNYGMGEDNPVKHVRLYTKKT